VILLDHGIASKRVGRKFCINSKLHLIQDSEGENISQHTYAILGAGRQGTAAAYDLTKFGETQKIIMADIREEIATQAAERINQLIGREVYHGLLEPKISASEIRDVCVIRVVGYGKKDGEETTVTIDLIDYYDEETGFTAMERLTGWHCAMMMGFQARGHIPAGGISMEIAVQAAEFMQAVRERGIKFEVRYE